MKRNNSFILFGLLWILICKAGFGQDNGLLAYWSFDEVSGPNIVETVKGTKDIIKGNFSFVNGVHGKGIKFDGFTTRITRDSLVNGIWNAPEIKEALTIEAWIAPQAYPWNWNAIVEQKDRYYFGLDATGHIGLRVFIDSYWRECVSAIQVPFMQWSHIAGTFDPNNGLTVFINGQEVGRFAIAGRFARKRPFEPSEVVDKYFTEHSAAGGAFQIGRNLDNLPAAGTRSIPASYSFDGIIDELKIYGCALDASEIKKSYESLHPSSSPPLTWRKLPIIPDGQKKFGAYYTSLKLYPEWDQLWRIDDYPDLVITFDDASYKMVFWHGTTYGLTLVTENGRWMAEQSAESHRTEYGCVEHMSDKQCRYSHVRLIENSPARIVVHWRYAPTDVLYNIGETDPITNWGDWVDEYYIIYPDGWAVRHVLVHGGQRAYSLTAPQAILSPGETRADIISMESVTLAKMDGTIRSFGPSTGVELNEFLNRAPIPNIAIVNMMSDFKPAWIYESPTVIIEERQRGVVSKPGMVAQSGGWGGTHWPVSQIPSDGRRALALDRFSSVEMFAPEPPQTQRKRDSAIEARWLTGFPKDPASTLPVALAWLQPPELKLSGADFAKDGYGRDDRAYHLHRLTTGSTKLQFTIQASDKSPAMNPAFVIDGWGEGGASLTLNGKPVAEGKDFRVGRIERLEGPSLVVWISGQLTRPSTIALTPTSEKN